DARAFLDKVWASHVHLHHTDPADLAGLLSLDDVDHLLTSVALRTPALRVVKAGTVLPPSQFTRSATMAGSPVTGLVDSRKVLSHFDSGATVVLQGLHRYWPPLTRLIRELELAIGHPCQANAYLTPPGSQGFARHSDSHDVFVFQTHGRKQWEIVEGGEEREVLLEPGLSMYLPTGTPHCARSQEQTSLHVTVGINRLTWRQALREISERVLADERYDGPLPAGYLDEPDRLVGLMAEELSSYARGLADLDAAAVVDERVTAFLSQRTPALRGGLNDLVGIEGLSDGTVVGRRPTAACVLRPEPERLSVLLGDRELRMPLRLTGAMEFVRDHDTFRVGDLAPWLDEESRLVVTRRLVREGLLRITQ
ncbi:MAG TPA: cupin domain-containing protein, partial [Nocardioidaceae bacterium]|nr:cupin domain-containing protein [Nocardioidaceae bacterium]